MQKVFKIAEIDTDVNEIKNKSTLIFDPLTFDSIEAAEEYLSTLKKYADFTIVPIYSPN